MRVVLDKSYRHCGLISEEGNSFSCNGLLYLKTTIGVLYFFCLFHVTCDNKTCFAKDAFLNSILQFFDTVVVEIFLCNNPVEFDISCYHKIALTVIARAELVYKSNRTLGSPLKMTGDSFQSIVTQLLNSAIAFSLIG